MSVVLDARYAVRSLVRSPLYAVIVIATLAIGIGPTTAIYSVVHALLLRDLPYRDADSLVVLSRFRNAGDHAPVSGPDFADFRRMNSTLSDMAAASKESFNVGSVAQPVRVEGSQVTPNFFDLLGARPLQGALPRSGAGKEVVLAYDVWQRTFGGANVIGKETRLNGEAYTIDAVMPRSFAFPATADLWIPYDLTPARLGHRAYHRLNVIGRLKSGVTVQQASAEMERIAKTLGNTYPETTRGIGARLAPLREELSGSLRKPLLLLLGAVAFLLLISCSNVANIALTRAASHRKEISVRMALGAGVGRVARQLLAESVLLSLFGGILGLLLAQVAIVVLRSIGGAYLTRPEEITLDRNVLAFNFAVAVITGIVFGLAALVERGSLFEVPRSGDRTGRHGGREGRIAREAIVVTIIAFSFVLLAGAGLMIRSFLKVRAIDVGIRPNDTLTLRVYLPETKYPDIPKRAAFYEQFVQRAGATPGIDAAALVSGLPLENTMSGDIDVPGEANPVSARRIASFTEISPGYFQAAGIPVIDGRDLTWDDVHHLAAADRAPVLVNETYATRYGHHSPLGQKLLVGGDLPAVVTGVVGDVKQTDARLPTPAHVYLPLGSPLPPRAVNFILRSSSLTPAAMAAIAKNVLHQLDPDVPPFRIRTLQQVVDDSQAGSRFQTILLTAFAATALLLATIGIYGVISYTVAQRTREVAIRTAVGAASSDIIRLVLGRVVRLAAIGVLIGVTGALVLTGWMQAVVFDVNAADPSMLIAVAAGTLITAIAASTLPARRAAKLEPMKALRAE
jgi:predicted permease